MTVTNHMLSPRTFPLYGGLDPTLRRWAIATMMRQRGISMADVGRHLGVSRQAAYQQFVSLTEDGYERLERAITEITDARAARLTVDEQDRLYAVIWDAQRATPDHKVAKDPVVHPVTHRFVEQLRTELHTFWKDGISREAAS